jgi:hypothetical protein
LLQSGIHGHPGTDAFIVVAGIAVVIAGFVTHVTATLATGYFFQIVVFEFVHGRSPYKDMIIGLGYLAEMLVLV